MSAPMKPVALTVVDTNTAEWQLFPVEYIKANLEHVPLMDDPDTGMMILKMVYRAGFTNPWHSHPCAHGVYVLDAYCPHLGSEYVELQSTVSAGKLPELR